jgi:hypothetical protein
VKGTIVRCLQELVEKKGGGREAWAATLKSAGLSPTHQFSTMDDIDDALVLKVIGAAAGVLKITQQQAIDAFGEHWSLTYAPSIYGVYFDKCNNARDFLLSLAAIHVRMTASMANASPPKFTYDDSAPDAVTMTYSSKRGLVALMPGLVRGVGKYYKEQVEVSVSGQNVKIRFLSAQSKREVKKSA